jgi:hypothetical protein
MEHASYREWFARYQRWVIVLVAGALCGVLTFSAWVETPSYTLYRIKRAVDTQDLETFRYYVDLDSVLDHALREVGGKFFNREKAENPEGQSPQQPSHKGLLKGLLSRLAPEVKGLVQDGARWAVERMITQPRKKSLIPYPALVAAMWQVRKEGGQAFRRVSLPIKTKQGAIVEVRMHEVPDSYWRVVEVTNVKALLAEIKFRSRREVPMVSVP